MPNSPQVIVIGPGAVGIGLAVKLALAGNHVSLLGRSGPLKTGSVTFDGQEQHSTFNESPEPDGSYCILTVKAYDLSSVGQQYAAILEKCAVVLCLQNGLGITDKLLQFTNVIQGVLWVSGERLAESKALWRTRIRIVLDKNDSRSAKIGDILEGAGVKVERSGNFQADVFRKLLVNLAYNPITAIYRIPNSEIPNHPEARKRAIAAAWEIKHLAKAMGMDVTLNPEEIVDSSAKTLGDFKSSTLQDLEAGRPMEIESLLEEPLRLAAQYNVSMPEIASIHKQLSEY